MSIPLSLSVGQVVERNALPARFHGQCGQVAGEGTLVACLYTCDRYPEDEASAALFAGEPVDIQWQVEGGYQSGTTVQVSDQSLSPHQSPRNAMLNKMCTNNDGRIERGEPLYARHCVHLLYRKSGGTPFTYGGLYVPCRMREGEGDEKPDGGGKFRTYACTLCNGQELSVVSSGGNDGV